MSSVKLTVFSIIIFLYAVITSPLGAQNLLSEEPANTAGAAESEKPAPVTGETASTGDTPLTEDQSDGINIIKEGSAFADENRAVPEQTAAASEEKKDDGLIFFESRGVIVEASQFFELRTFDEIFPALQQSQRIVAMGRNGLRQSFEPDGSPLYAPDPSSGINLYNNVIDRSPSHMIEALIVIPYNEKELDLLDVYNALGRIDYLKDQTIRMRNGDDVNVFKETTRLNNAQNRRAIPDPPPANTLPHAETMFLRFTDAYIGSLFFRADLTMSLYGMTYNLTNFRDISFAIFRIMKAERLSINLYIEPIKEGILIYSLSGLFLPGFIVNRMNLTPNINNRISVLIRWITEGLRRQEIIARARDKETLIRTLLKNEHFLRMISDAE
ncbi:MAG: hypothetical protein FWB73_06525 [Treponema sp.]|nr:hypothetical protein [Treponema sp.]